MRACACHVTAAIEALRAIRRRDLVVVVRSDSRYLIDCCGKWLPGWKRRGWQRREGPLKNVDLLQALDELIARQRVTWEWVRAHAGERGNERVDQLANGAMDRIGRGADPRAERAAAGSSEIWSAERIAQRRKGAKIRTGAHSSNLCVFASLRDRFFPSPVAFRTGALAPGANLHTGQT
jgi:ribonuclease HI